MSCSMDPQKQQLRMIFTLKNGAKVESIRLITMGYVEECMVFYKSFNSAAMPHPLVAGWIMYACCSCWLLILCSCSAITSIMLQCRLDVKH